MKICHALLICTIVLCACGPSQAELQATATQAAAVEFATQTALAPTSTPTFTPTSIPTLTPTPTSTPTITPTPTPIPTPDAGAMIDWKALELPSYYEAIDPDEMGVNKGELAYEATIEGKKVKKYIESSFTFSNPANDNWIFGWTVVLTTTQDQDYFDSNIEDIKDSFRDYLIGVYNLQVDKLSQSETIGNISAGAKATFTHQEEVLLQIDLIKFRTGEVGGSVYVIYNDEDTPVISVQRLARIYVNSIQNGYQGCKLISIEYVGIPPEIIFDYQAEGFYPAEERLLILEGGVQVDRETKPLIRMALGATEDEPRANRKGEIKETWDAGTIDGEDVDISGDYLFTLTGLFSGCTITQTVTIPSQ